MLIQTKTFKVRLIAKPQIKDKEDNLTDLGKFTVGKKYRVYTIADCPDYTDFLVSDDEGKFYWLNFAIFRAI